MSEKQVRVQYTREFKLEAVRQVRAGQAIAVVARACYELYRMMVRVVGRVQGCLVGPTPAM